VFIASYKFTNDILIKLRNEKSGKKILLAGHSNWGSEDMIQIYQSAWKITHTFRQMKDLLNLRTQHRNRTIIRALCLQSYELKSRVVTNIG